MPWIIKQAEEVEVDINRRTVSAFLLIIIIAILGIVCLLGGLVGTGLFLNAGDKIQKVDAIVVLSGDEGERVREAARLYKAGYASYLVITKTDNEEIGEDRTYSEKLMRIAMEGGVPSDSILFSEGMATNTIEEAHAVVLLAQKRNLSSLLVVTGPYHVRRARLIFRKIAARAEIKTLATGVQDSWYHPTTWFLSQRGWRQTVSEVLGLAAITIQPELLN